ncbi:DUF2510 domain-containing protein [Cellulomonas palmilytica]|uniref:DUF2510 domain-containing protein n=1 Tax=Cellulomonas palmilytica TaxID=2608402 RepID=UPI001F20E1EE|nr:DUF2510 domain-containing protein [Cellulomonas palmilytica]
MTTTKDSMTTPSPGWYPDPQRPEWVRWFDGVSWTTQVRQARRPVAAGPTKPPWSGGKIALVSVGSAVAAGVVIAGFGVLAGPRLVDRWDDLLFAETLEGQSCEQVVVDEVRLVREQGSLGDIELVAIDQVRTVENHLETAVRPSDGASTHLLTCEGIARWADGYTEPIRLVLTIDSDNQTWIDDAWDESSTGSA